MPSSRRLLGTLAIALLLTACSEEGGNGVVPVPTTLSLSSSTVTLDAIGATQQLTGTVRDQNGNTLPSESVSYASDDVMVATVSATGLVTAVDNGTATITATSGTLSATSSVTVAQVPGQVTDVAGNAQTGVVGDVLAESLSVRIADRLGNAMMGVAVDFAVSTDGGSVSPATTVSGAMGQAATEWTLGTVPGTHTVTATPGTGTGSFQFSATVDPGPADSLAEVSGNSQTGQANTTLPNPLVVQVVDQFGNAVEGHGVDFQVTGGSGVLDGGTGSAIATTDSAGEASVSWTLGPELGSQTVDASGTKPAGGALNGSPITFTATATGAQADSVEMFDGDTVGLVGTPINFPPAVRVLDAGGNPFEGATVTFAVTSGGGSGTGLVVQTDTAGIAEVGSWTLGPAATANTMTATVTGMGISGNPVTFTAEGRVAAFDIEIRYVSDTTTSQAQAFRDAEAFWEAAIYGNLQSLTVNTPAGQSCAGISLPAINETIDDIVIYVELDSIDGPSGTLGAAGPCLIRQNAPGTLIFEPIVGGMVFDTADLALLESNNFLDEAITHEMGHVLGFGTLWGLVPTQADPYRQDPVCGQNGGTPGQDTHYVGPNSLKIFDEIGGADYMGAKVPVENVASCPGSSDGHWRESVFGTELMTPSANLGVANPLSAISIASIGEMGDAAPTRPMRYLVTLSAAQAYGLPVAGAAPPAGNGLTVDFRGDIWQGPIYGVDPFGQIRLVRPDQRR